LVVAIFFVWTRPISVTVGKYVVKKIILKILKHFSTPFISVNYIHQ